MRNRFPTLIRQVPNVRYSCLARLVYVGTRSSFGLLGTWKNFKRKRDLALH